MINAEVGVQRHVDEAVREGFVAEQKARLIKGATGSREKHAMDKMLFSAACQSEN
jgi:hypothetical protein